MPTCNRHGPTFKQYIEKSPNKKAILEQLVKDGKYVDCDTVADILKPKENVKEIISTK